MIQLPDSVKVGGFTFKVEEWDRYGAQSSQRFGECSTVEFIIRVARPATPEMFADTLLHEITHAIFWVYNIHDEDKEERTTATLSTGFVQVFRDNPDVLRFLNEVFCEQVEVKAHGRLTGRLFVPDEDNICIHCGETADQHTQGFRCLS